MDFKNKTVFMTGGTRGIGKAIALKLATLGVNVAIAAKSVVEDPRLGGTIFSAAAEVDAAGGKGLGLQCDIREEEQIQAAVAKTVETFGGIDIVINNASAIYLSNTETLSAKQFDLMHSINIRGTFLVGKTCMPYLKQSTDAHILTLSPPLNLDVKWLAKHAAYTIAKYGMSMLTLGWAEEFKENKIASNTLWPRTTIDTAAVRNLLGGPQLTSMSRSPEIMADAAAIVLSKPWSELNGQSLIDDEVLSGEGITDLEKYAITPGGKLFTDLFL